MITYEESAILQYFQILINLFFVEDIVLWIDRTVFSLHSTGSPKQSISGTAKKAV